MLTRWRRVIPVTRRGGGVTTVPTAGTTVVTFCRRARGLVAAVMALMRSDERRTCTWSVIDYGGLHHGVFFVA